MAVPLAAAKVLLNADVPKCNCHKQSETQLVDVKVQSGTSSSQVQYFCGVLPYVHYRNVALTLCKRLSLNVFRPPLRQF